MAIDPNIAMNFQMPQIANQTDLATKALTLKSLGQQSQMQDQAYNDDQNLRNAFKQNVSADGTVNRQGVLGDLAKGGSPKQVMDYTKIFQGQDLDKLKAQSEIGKQVSWSIKDQPSLTSAKQYAIQNNLPGAQQIPDDINAPGAKDYIQNWQMHALDGDKQLDQHMKEQQLAVSQQNSGTELMNAKSKMEENSLRRDDRADAIDVKGAAALDKHLSLGWTGRSGQAGVVQGKVVSAQAAQALIDQGTTQPGSLDSRQIEELAQSTSKLLGGGTSASARVEALVPHTFWGQAQSMKEWLTNNPTGTGQEEFVKRMAETVAREKALAETQMKQFQVEGLPAHRALSLRNPDLYNDMLKAKGIDPSMIDANGQYKAPPSQTPKPATVIQGGHTYNLNPQTGQYE